GARVRHVLDMRSGVRFGEEYANPHADIRRLDEWIGWPPGGPDSEPRGLYRFLTTLAARAPHGGGVPAPVLVPPGRLRRRAARPGYPRPDAARQPAYEHGRREVLQLAAGTE